MGKPANGFVTHNPLSWNSSREHVPPISYDIVIDKEDSWWLDRIDGLLSSKTASDRRLKKALEYFYLGWFLSENDRIPFNFMTLDALFGNERKTDPKTGNDIGNKNKLKTGIPKLFPEITDDKRLDELYDLRSQFLHGGSPDIYDSKKYDYYLRKHFCDPALDIEYLAASCLRRILFGTKFEMQNNPYSEEIEKLKHRGVLPTESNPNTLIQET